MSSGTSREGSDFDVKVIGAQAWDPVNDNVDVEIRFQDGRRYAATFFTAENIRTIFEKNRASGECRSGLYFWASDMIIVETLTLDTVRETVAGLVEAGELDAALKQLE